MFKAHHVLQLLLLAFVALLVSHQQPTLASQVKFELPEESFYGKDPESFDFYLEKVKTESAKHSWWAEYTRYQLWTQNKNMSKACESLKRLLQAPEFPLHRLVVFRYIESCKHKMSPEDFDSLVETTPPWLNEVSLNATAKHSKRLKNYARAAEAKFSLAKQATTKKKKEALLLEARKLATRPGAEVVLREIIRALRKNSPRFNKRIKTLSQRIQVANDYRRARDFNSARKMYRKVIRSKTKSTLKARAFRGYAFTYKLQGKKKEYLKAYQDYVTWIRKSAHKETVLRWKAELQLIKIYWTQGLRPRAERNLDFVVKIAPEDFRVESYFILGLIEMEKQNWSAANSFFDMSLAQTPDAKIASKEKVLWSQSWSLLRAGKFKEALKPLDILIEELPEGETNRYQFWKAWLSEKKSPKTARRLYKKLADRSSYSYYGILAHKRLKRPLKYKYKQTSSVRLFSKKEAKVFGDHTLSWLLAVNEYALARKYIESKNELLKEHPKFSEYLDVLSNSYLKTFANFSKSKKSTKKRWMRDKLHLLFPNPFANLVRKSAGDFYIDEELVLAIMRQESAFNPSARSPMDAFGLLQLLPRTAKGTAERNQLFYSNSESLTQPDVIIPLGTSYLRELMEKYDGSLILTAANYNASEGAVKNWLKTRYTKNPLLFIEEVPYKETRTYIKLILRNYMIYKSLNSQDNSWLIPDHLFDLPAKSLL